MSLEKNTTFVFRASRVMQCDSIEYPAIARKCYSKKQEITPLLLLFALKSIELCGLGLCELRHILSPNRQHVLIARYCETAMFMHNKRRGNGDTVPRSARNMMLKFGYYKTVIEVFRLVRCYTPSGFLSHPDPCRSGTGQKIRRYE
jgi:hypothetical protein